MAKPALTGSAGSDVCHSGDPSDRRRADNVGSSRWSGFGPPASRISGRDHKRGVQLRLFRLPDRFPLLLLLPLRARAAGRWAPRFALGAASVWEAGSKKASGVG